jgi:hypothetical protein
MLCAIDSAREQEVFVSELSKLYPVHNSDTGLLGYFELDRSMRFLLHHDGSWGYACTMGYIAYS